MTPEERFKIHTTPVVIYNPFHMYRNKSNDVVEEKTTIIKNEGNKNNMDFITGLAVGMSF